MSNGEYIIVTQEMIDEAKLEVDSLQQGTEEYEYAQQYLEFLLDACVS